MKSFLKSLSFPSMFAPPKNRTKDEKILFYLIGILTLWASLEFIQDYIKALLAQGNFYVLQSLAYKLFWFLFIPLSMGLRFIHKRCLRKRQNMRAMLLNSWLIILIALLHLWVFSCFLHLISYIIADHPWSMSFLLTQKLSTRLYLALFFYMILSFIYQQRKPQAQEVAEQITDSSTLLVKSGKKTSLLSTQKIFWIASDGPYLEIHTSEKKYVILDSLKNIIHTLPGHFTRIHKSSIVNTEQIESFQSRGNGDYDLLLKCGKMLRLSRNYAHALKGKLLR